MNRSAPFQLGLQCSPVDAFVAVLVEAFEATVEFCLLSGGEGKLVGAEAVPKLRNQGEALRRAISRGGSSWLRASMLRDYDDYGCGSGGVCLLRNEYWPRRSVRRCLTSQPGDAGHRAWASKSNPP
jgi:hypothetical protein